MKIRKEESALAYLCSIARAARVRTPKERHSQMVRSVSVLILTGEKFGSDDFAVMERELDLSTWGTPMREQFYRQAIIDGNTSACLSIERWLGRPPFLLGSRRLGVGIVGSGISHTPAAPGGAGFYLWEEFPAFQRIANPLRAIEAGHGAVPVTVTSIAGPHLLACSYEDTCRTRILRRISITCEQLAAQERTLADIADGLPMTNESPAWACAEAARI